MSGDLEPGLFGTVERRLFRATAVLFAIVAFVGLLAGVIWVSVQAIAFFYNLVMPLSVAGILALVLHPWVDYLEQRWRLSRVVATSLIVLFFVAFIVSVILVVVPALIRQIVQFTEAAPGILAGWQEYLSNRYPDLTKMVLRRAEEVELGTLVPDMEETGETVRFYIGTLVGLSFVPLMLFFALLSGGQLRGQTLGALSVFSATTRARIMYFIDVFLAQVTGFFRGQLVIAVIMGAMFATGFTLIGLQGGILIGLTLGLLNIVPFLGTVVGLLIVLPLSYFQPSGGFELLALSLLVFTVVQLIESWLLTPKIMADRSGLHPGVVLISVFFWGIAFGGITGMILAVPLTAFLLTVWHQAKESVAQSITSEEEESRIEIPIGTAEPSKMGGPPEDRPQAHAQTAFSREPES